MTKLLRIFITIGIGALGGSALGLYIGINGVIVGAIAGALILTYAEHLRPNGAEEVKE